MASEAAPNGTDEALPRHLSVLIDRIQFAREHGLQFDADRDLYQRLGYQRTITLRAMRARYDRGDIAHRIVDAFPAATWSVPPIVREDDDESKQTQFEAAWGTLTQRLNLWSYLDRMDRVAGVGHYAILLLGLDDGQALDQPVQRRTRKPESLLFLRPYAELSAPIDRLVEDPRDPRFGLPLLYRLKLTTGAPRGGAAATRTQRVHWSRVIHFADGLLEDDVYGTPRLRPIWNRLDDLDKVAGGSGEMYWRAGYRGYHADIPPDARLDDDVKQALDERFKEYEHGLRRWIQTEGGVAVKAFEASVADPRGAFEVLLSLIAGATGIPQRILIGSERGRLASDQDRQNWSERVKERMEAVAIPSALRPLIDRLIEFGVLPKPRRGYQTLAPDLHAISDEAKARIAAARAQAAEKLGASTIPPHEWRPWLDLPAEPSEPPRGRASGDSE